jgi:hypothetical protein
LALRDFEPDAWEGAAAGTDAGQMLEYITVNDSQDEIISEEHVRYTVFDPITSRMSDGRQSLRHPPNLGSTRHRTAGNYLLVTWYERRFKQYAQSEADLQLTFLVVWNRD